MSQQSAPFILVDGSSYLFRAYHALPPLTTSKGSPSGAIYGVINMLRRLIKDYQPEYMAMVFDPKGKTFRNDLYSEYKANRGEMPEELAVQIKPLFDIIRAMGLPLVIVEGVEADDVIGTLAGKASEEGWQTLISTGDKDMAQLVNEQVTLINTMNGKIFDPAGVEEKFCVKPEQIIDYLTLMGDSADNIPGVPKVGPKTASKWLNQYGSLDEVIAHAEEIKGKVGESFRASLDDLPLSKQLVTIKMDVPMEEELKELKPQAADNEKLAELFAEFEFKTWLAEVLSDDDKTEQADLDYQAILTQDDFDLWLKKLAAANVFAFDTETTSLNYMQAKLVGLSFSLKAGQAIYIPVAHDYEDAPEQLSCDYVLEKLKPILENEKIKKIGQNIKYDINVLANHGVDVQGAAFDTMLESFVLTSANRNDLDTLSLKYLGHKNITFEEVAGKGKKQITFNQVLIEQATPYACEDADMTWQLHQIFWGKLQAYQKLKNVLSAIEMPLVPLLGKVERNGVLVDIDKLNKQSEQLGQRTGELEAKVHQLTESEFNLSSPKQLQEILYEKMGLPILKKTPKGAPSTAEPVLQELAQDYPLAKIILEYRSLSKLKSTYTDKLPDQIDPTTGRVHTSYHQAGAATGRFSSSDPNLQNIPVRTEEGRRIRQAFIAPSGYKLLAADYSQIELRIMAHLSNDAGLLDAFAHGLDIHCATAAEVFSVPLDKVTKEQRRRAKAINFGLIYGMSAFGLSQQLDIERGEAQSYIELYFARYPDVEKYMNEIRAQAHEQEYVETFFGRRLYLPEINSSNQMRSKAAERTAVNAPMQGTAADIIKQAMVKVDQLLIKSKLDVKMIMQVHDELVFEVAEQDIDAVKELVVNGMQDAVKLSVPLIVDVGIGDNWDEAH